jgi:hypothetical protein
MNEEEVKIKHIIPWLRSAGIDASELQLETTFSVKVGRHTVPVDGAARARDKAGARLDILVRRGNKNLLIIETKAADLSLTDDDRDQAISYARLVHPVAPYALVTNGSDFRLYESLTKKHVAPSEIRINGFEAVLPPEDIAQAQRLFFGLNAANLTTFCRQQVAKELRLVAGEIGEDKKYIRQLHVPRSTVLGEVEQLYGSDRPGLLLLGPPGSGKTCELCWVAERLLAGDTPVLFFNAFSLESGILNAIADEFQWTFVGAGDPIQILKRLEAVALERPLTIIVDAIDEWLYEARVSHIAAILKGLEGRKMRIILSCKASVVDQFLHFRGNETHTALLAKRIDLAPFSEREFFEALAQYRVAYQFFGLFEDAILAEARHNPFLLRVLFDVAKTFESKHLTFDSPKLFETYYHRSIAKVIHREAADRTLTAVARLLYEQNTDWIAEPALRAALGLRVNEPFMEELFDFGLLLHSGADGAAAGIGFYFQQLRDYIIAFKACRFDDMTASSLQKMMSNELFIGMRGDVFRLYYRLASTEHKQVFDGKVRANASLFLHCYIRLIQTHFPALKQEFKPQTDRGIGFIAELMLWPPTIGPYGFRSIGEDEEDVYFIPVERLMEKSNLAYLGGAKDFTYRPRWPALQNGIDTEKAVVNEELLVQLRGIVEQGRLNESQTPELVSEFIIATLYEHRAIFKGLLVDGESNARFPIKLSEVSACLLRAKLFRHFEYEMVETLRKAKQTSNEGSSGFSYSRRSLDWERIAANVDRVMSTGEMPPFRARFVDLEELERSVLRAVERLSASTTEIERPLLPDIVWPYGAQPPMEALKASVGRLYAAFLNNYRVLVETNFPTLRQNFALYAQLPVSIYLQVDPPVKDFRNPSQTHIGVNAYFVKAVGESEVRVVDQVTWEDAVDDCRCVIGEVEAEGLYHSRTGIGELLGVWGDAFRAPIAGTPLRKLVYGRLRRELKAVEHALLKELKLAMH